MVDCILCLEFFLFAQHVIGVTILKFVDSRLSTAMILAIYDIIISIRGFVLKNVCIKHQRHWIPIYELLLHASSTGKLRR